MPIYTIANAQAEFESLVDRAEAGELILIVSPSGRLVGIAPLAPEDKTRLIDEPVE